MEMLQDPKLQGRVVAAFTFKKEVYAEVEHDESFTRTAWIIVGVVSFLSQLGGLGQMGFIAWIAKLVIGTALAVGGFAAGAWLISFLGQQMFKAEVTFEEMVRCLGLAYVWQIVGLIGAIASYVGPLACILAPVSIIGVVAVLAAWLIAAKEALDLEWGPTAITVVVGWIATAIIGAIAGVLLGLLGAGAAGIGGMLGG